MIFIKTALKCHTSYNVLVWLVAAKVSFNYVVCKSISLNSPHWRFFNIIIQTLICFEGGVVVKYKQRFCSREKPLNEFWWHVIFFSFGQVNIRWFGRRIYHLNRQHWGFITGAHSGNWLYTNLRGDVSPVNIERLPMLKSFKSHPILQWKQSQPSTKIWLKNLRQHSQVL